MKPIHEFPEQSEVLYCFKLVDLLDHSELLKYEVTRYEKQVVNSFRTEYRFPGKFVASKHKLEIVNEDKLDRVCNNKLYTLEPTLEAAEAKFEEHYKNRIVQLETKLTAVNQEYKSWRSRRE